MLPPSRRSYSLVTLLCALALTSACGGAAPTASGSPAAGGEPATAASPEPTKHLLSGCTKTQGGAGLQLACGGFNVILSRFTSDTPVDSEMLQKLESDLLAGMHSAIKSGALKTYDVSVPKGDGQVPVRGFTVARDGQTLVIGTVMAAVLDASNVLSAVCFTKQVDSTVCTELMSQLLTVGLPEDL
ncbi:MAG: hypothetical protein KF718_08995 [Polyangiaceae bacterium]|nr:hypothetical protein [Polyangiaceae bacterium]